MYSACLTTELAFVTQWIWVVPLAITMRVAVLLMLSWPFLTNGSAISFMRINCV